MKNSSQTSRTPLGTIAALFDDQERKQLFRKYLIFLGWVEIFILLICWLYQLGTKGYDRFGPVEVGFPWKTYFLISFLAPVAITFIIAIVILAFNRYFGDGEPATAASSAEMTQPAGNDIPLEKSGRGYRFFLMVSWLQRLPLLGLLLLLAAGVGIVYKLDAIAAFITDIGGKSLHVLLVGGSVILGVAAVLAITIMILNYKLRKQTMDYQYKSEVAQRFGLVILDDSTVLNREGKVLVAGKNLREEVPLLTDSSSETDVSNYPH